MRTLITGGYGYIGGHLAHHLLNAGRQLTILDTMFTAKPWNLPGHVDQYYVLNASVCNQDAVGRATRDVDLIYHLAARVDWANNPRHAIRIFHTNVMGTATLLSVANAVGIDNVVVASSAAVYGNVVGAEEFGPTEPINLYGCSKLAMEAVCRHYQNIGMNIKILRFFNVWGGEHSGSVVNRFAFDENCVIYGDGSQTRDFVHISDVLAALIAAPNWEPSIYNVATGEETTISGLWNLLRDNKPKFKKEGPGFDEIQRSCADISYVLGNTKWQPKVKLSELSREEIRQLCQ